MKWTLAASLGFVTAVYATPAPQAVIESIAPEGTAPEGCKADYNGKFEVSVSRLGKRGIERRGCNNPNALLLTLNGGVLKDSKDRTGYIASNFQFQFDGPPQSGALFTAGFSVCGNNSLALGSSAVWYQCLSGDFYNLYDRSWAFQCEPIEIIALPCDDSNGGSGGSVAEPTTVGSQIVQTTIVTAIVDGQPQVHTTTVAIPMCQIGDGQIQVHTTPCSSLNVQPTPVITEIFDGQPQAPTATALRPVITEISDGQPQAPTYYQPQPPIPVGTGTGTGTGVVPIITSPITVPISGGSRALPGAMAAFAIAFLGVIGM